jgi:hypothetical protein
LVDDKYVVVLEKKKKKTERKQITAVSESVILMNGRTS